MSVVQPQTPSPITTTANRQITIVSHCTLFYWWPVWAVGFLLGILSLLWGDRMAIVPAGTEVVQNAEVIGPMKENKETRYKDREVLVLPASDPKNPDHKLSDDPNPLRLHIARSKSFGVLFATVLLLVIVITNVPLRGMWSFMVIFLVIALSIIFALAGWWETILRNLNYLDIRINAGGYFFLSTILFLIWLFTLLIFDKQIYMVFTPGQFKVCTEVGGGEQVYSTVGLTLERQRSDLFRHWILGLGSGDLIVKTTGAQAHHFEMPNVLFIGRKVQQIEDMVRQIPDR
jgi:hypothetical protein